MPYFQIRAAGIPAAECYWVQAASAREARHLVALNVSAARHAGDPQRFDCVAGAERQPPADLIFRRYGAPLPIRER
jgi:hypothetical protein